MISRRNRRPSSPQETLRQFALNNSKGVDSSKAPTEFSTIARSENLIVNTDGSLSLRKPIEFVPGTTAVDTAMQYYLYDSIHRLKVFPPVDSLPQYPYYRMYISGVDKVHVKYTQYTGATVTLESTDVNGIIIPQGDVEVINLNSSSILGNCNVDFSKLVDGLDPSLVDDVDAILPRYIRVSCTDTEGWVFEIIPSEVNTLSTAEGEIAFNPNLTLDNPTALRDGYNAIVPVVKGIVAYVPTDVVDGVSVPVGFTPVESALSGECLSKAAPKPPSIDLGATVPFENTVKLKGASGATASVYEDLTLNCNNVNDNNVVIVQVNLNTDTELADLTEGTYTASILAKVTVVPQYTFMDDGSIAYGDPVTRRLPLQTFTFTESTAPVDTPLSMESMFAVKSFPRCKIEVLVQNVEIKTTYTLTTSTVNETITVNEITESAKRKRYRIATALSKNTTHTVFLKAFCNLPKKEIAEDEEGEETTEATEDKENSSSSYYGAWFYSKDGIQWNSLIPSGDRPIYVRELNPEWKPVTENASPTAADYKTVVYYPIDATSPSDTGITLQYSNGSSWKSSRTDVACINAPGNVLQNYQYRFKIIAIEALNENDVELKGMQSDEVPAGSTVYRARATVSQQEYTPVIKPDFEFFDIEFGNPILGKKFYHKKSIYSYGSEKFHNNIFVSDIDSFITPLYNVIDLDANESSQATCIIPWRDYLVSATEHAIYLHTKVSDGFLTKTVNTSIGIPKEDARCCKAILNGILFKSGPRIYQLYPNLYAGDDSTLNLTEISKPVEEYLEEYILAEHTPFAFSTESEYILMLPNETDTLCLRYNYSSKLWAVCRYPVVFTNYTMRSLNDVRVFGKRLGLSAEFVFDAECDDSDYGDTLPIGITTEKVPICFEWDTGQKTDNISIQKQFVESKLVFATKDTLEAFPMSLLVHVDGDPHVTTLDLNSDAPFWKEGSSIGVTNTAFRLSTNSDVDVFRQLIVRYSGKGRSIRHILSGAPTSNFKLYETYIRYKTLNVKR